VATLLFLLPTFPRNVQAQRYIELLGGRRWDALPSAPAPEAREHTPGRAWGLGRIFSENQDVLTIAIQNTVPAPNELVILKIR
jgi:hypothetical protein